MNILFLTIAYPIKKNQNNIYSDLMEEFVKNNHNVYVISSNERRNRENSRKIKINGVNILLAKTGNMQKTNIIEKGISMLIIEKQYINVIKERLQNISIDLIIYSTPPITFYKVIQYIKKRDNAASYLLLKDIFPQNAIDLGMLKKDSIIYKYFRKKEINLYRQSDFIGCMSPKNVDYLLKYNKYIVKKDKVEICPNSIRIDDINTMSDIEKSFLKIKYRIKEDAIVLLYGGNIGKPQGIDFLIKVLNRSINWNNVEFIIVGSGTEYNKLKKTVNKLANSNIKLFKFMPKGDYEKLVQICDIGLIFLNHKFTIPNFPSRILDYMKYKKPILAATDANTDVGKIIKDNRLGLSCISDKINNFEKCIDYFVEHKEMIVKMGINSHKYLIENYSVQKSYQIIMNHFTDKERR